MLIGIDTSKWDPIVDWKRYTWDFAFIKASEGVVPDRVYKPQMTAARGYTIRSPYHFFRVYIDPVEAAKRFVDVIGDDPGELPPVLDLEAHNGDPKNVGPRALKWIDTVYNLTNRMPITYTSEGFATTEDVDLYKYTDFKHSPLWLAQYPWDRITTRWSEIQREQKIMQLLQIPEAYRWPPPIAPWSNVRVIQWTAKCKPVYVPGYPLGVKEAVDINFYPGTIMDLFTEFKIGTVPTPNEDDMTDSITTLTAFLKDLQPANLRAGAGLNQRIITTLTGPLSIEGIGQKTIMDGYHWIQIVDMTTRVPRGWVALTTSFTNVVYNPNGINQTTRKVLRSVIFYDNGDQETLVPEA